MFPSVLATGELIEVRAGLGRRVHRVNQHPRELMTSWLLALRLQLSRFNTTFQLSVDTPSGLTLLLAKAVPDPSSGEDGGAGLADARVPRLLGFKTVH